MGGHARRAQGREPIRFVGGDTDRRGRAVGVSPSASRSSPGPATGSGRPPRWPWPGPGSRRGGGRGRRRGQGDRGRRRGTGAAEPGAATPTWATWPPSTGWSQRVMETFGRDRRPGEQRRGHAARLHHGSHRAGLGPHHAGQRQGRLLLPAAGGARDDPAAERHDHQHRVDRGEGLRGHLERDLRGQQGERDLADPHRRAPARPPRHQRRTRSAPASRSPRCPRPTWRSAPATRACRSRT